jgi:hypothetical protein
VDQVVKVGESGFTPQPARVESKLIDDHVASADKPGGAALVEIGTAMVAAKPVGTTSVECVGRRKVLLYSTELSTGRSLIGIPWTAWPTEASYKAGEDRMEKLLLTCGRPPLPSSSSTLGDGAHVLDIDGRDDLTALV